MKDVREAIRDVIRKRILPWIERDGISKLILPEQITPADCTKPIECSQPPRWRSKRQVLMVGLTGKAPYYIDNKNFIFTPGRILLIPGGVSRGPAQTTVQFVEDFDPNRRSSFLLAESYLSGIWIQLLRAVPGGDRLEVTWHYLFLGRHFDRLTSSLLEEVRSRPSNYARISRCILMEFWERCLGTETAAEGIATTPSHRLSRSSRAKSRGRSTPLTTGRSTVLTTGKRAKGGDKSFPERVRIAGEFIQSHYHMPIRLEDIAAAADSSVNHLGRQFKAATGITPIAYLLEVRMEAARQLLLTDIKVFEVAHMVGIDSPTYFSKVFLGSNGITPRQFRRKISQSRTAFARKSKKTFFP